MSYSFAIKYHKVKGFQNEIKSLCGRAIYSNHKPYPRKIIFITIDWHNVTCKKCLNKNYIATTPPPKST